VFNSDNKVYIRQTVGLIQNTSHMFINMFFCFHLLILIFTERCVCIAQTMLLQDVCLSVYPSVTRRYCVEADKHTIKLFPPSDSHVILAFTQQTLWQHSDGDLHNGGVECCRCRGYEKSRFFDQYLALSRKRYKIWPSLVWKCQ